MKGSLRQRSPGSWELTVETGRDASGKRRRRYFTVRGTKAQTKEAMRDAYDDHGRVFAGACGEWINPNQLTRAVESLGERVGHPGMTVRSLRHFHASVALQTGQNIVVVSKRLGHSNVSITSDIYAHSLPNWQRQAVDAFAQAMEGN